MATNSLYLKANHFAHADSDHKNISSPTFCLLLIQIPMAEGLACWLLCKFSTVALSSESWSSLLSQVLVILFYIIITLHIIMYLRVDEVLIFCLRWSCSLLTIRRCRLVKVLRHSSTPLKRGGANCAANFQCLFESCFHVQTCNVFYGLGVF